MISMSAVRFVRVLLTDTPAAYHELFLFAGDGVYGAEGSGRHAREARLPYTRPLMHHVELWVL